MNDVLRPRKNGVSAERIRGLGIVWCITADLKLEVKQAEQSRGGEDVPL